MECPGGFKQDQYGCNLCECAPESNAPGMANKNYAGIKFISFN
jgi:hypothetical protein